MMEKKLASFLIALADDQMILGHRDSEWCGHAPILEEDIAFANIAIDELGHARLWYEIAGQLLGEDPVTLPDQLIFFRDPVEFRNLPMAALPNGDWAFTIVRQYLLDELEMIILLRLSKSKNDQVSAAANKIIKEELYHLRHAAAWLPRLGRGTDESHRRMQQAVNDLWPYVDHFFEPLPDNFELAGAGLIPEIEKLEKEFSAKVKQSLETASLEIPENLKPVHTSRINQGKVIEDLVVEMQSVARAFPNASW